MLWVNEICARFQFNIDFDTGHTYRSVNALLPQLKSNHELFDIWIYQPIDIGVAFHDCKSGNIPTPPHPHNKSFPFMTMIVLVVQDADPILLRSEVFAYLWAMSQTQADNISVPS